MKIISFNKFSKLLDEYRRQEQEPTFWLIEKIYLYISMIAIVGMFLDLIKD